MKTLIFFEKVFRDFFDEQSQSSRYTDLVQKMENAFQKFQKIIESDAHFVVSKNVLKLE